MSEYKIMLTGNVADGANKEAVAQSFSQMFKVPLDKAKNLFDGKPRPLIVGRKLDKATAKRVYLALQKIGAEATLIEPESAPEVAPNPPPTLQKSPKKQTAPTPPEPPELKPIHEPQPGYQFEIEGRPDYSFLTVTIPADETFKVEASAMATMDTHISMKTKMKGGFSRLLSKESLFINEFTAEGGSGDIGIAPGPPGDLRHVYLRGSNDVIFLQNSAFVASAMTIDVETKWQGLTKGFFSGENLFLIRCSGKGDLWFNSYGAIIEIDVEENYVVDTGNIVAFTGGLEYEISKVGGYKSLFFSGEGFVCRFSGKGKIWIQTRVVNAMVSWVHPFRPVKKKG